VPAAALPTDTFDGRAVLGPSVDRLHEQLAGATGWDARYALVLQWLRQRLAGHRPGETPPAVVAAWRRLERSGGRLGVSALADDLGLDRRRLARVFTAELGVGPKVAARLIRFDAARRDVAVVAARPGPSDLSGVALRHGYYDHAHLVREFTALAGLAPTAWVAAERANQQAAERANQQPGERANQQPGERANQQAAERADVLAEVVVATARSGS
jgi:AraC-like DNA-binding protein